MSESNGVQRTIPAARETLVSRIEQVLGRSAPELQQLTMLGLQDLDRALELLRRAQRKHAAGVGRVRP